jgi:hypothetical protein
MPRVCGSAVSTTDGPLESDKCRDKQKKPAHSAWCAGFPYLKCRFIHPPIPGEVDVVCSSRQVFWLAIHPRGRLPDQAISGIRPFVLAHSGGSAGVSNPSSLQGPCGLR